MNKKLNNKGFTLVELLAVLAILIAIMAIAIPSISSSLERTKAKQNEAKSKVFASAAELYVADHKGAIYNNLANNNANSCYILISDINYLTEEDMKDANGDPINGYIIFTKPNKYEYSETKSDGLQVCNTTPTGNDAGEGGANSTGEPALLSDYIKYLYNDGTTITTTNIAKSASKPKIYLNSNKGIMLDNNEIYRYYGNDPNNYVKFNGELWRIISVSNVKKYANDTTGSQRVKIIRSIPFLNEDDVYGLYFDDSSNDWTSSTLKDALDAYYYKESDPCSGCVEDVDPICNGNFTCDFTGLKGTHDLYYNNALWYLGGIPTGTALYADDYYDYERTSGVTTWQGIVGTIYPSDYAYAADLSSCTSIGSNYSSCNSSNWLDFYDNNDAEVYSYWTMNSNSNNGYESIMISSNGSIGEEEVNVPFSAFPVVYLLENVTRVSGEGTATNPFVIGLN